MFVNDMSLYPHACKSIHVVMWECDTRTCIELCSWSRCCWGNWVLWPAGGWTGVLPVGPVDTGNRDNTAVSTTHTHTFTLCLHFLKITGGIHLGEPHLFANLWDPLLYRARKGPCFLLREGKYNSVTLPHSFLFFHTLSNHLSTELPAMWFELPAMWFATLQYEQTKAVFFWLHPHRIFGPMAKCVSQNKNTGNSKSVGKQLFEEHHQDAHLLLALKRRGYIVNIDLWKREGVKSPL